MTRQLTALNWVKFGRLSRLLVHDGPTGCPPDLPEGRLNEVGLAFGFGHGRFACGIVVPVVHCSDPRLAMNQRFLGSLEVSYFQAATIQIP